jgi:ribosomal-protein-alanine N-acetyltransferase
MVRERIEADLRGCVDLLRVVHLTHRYPVRWPADPVAWLSAPGPARAWVATADDVVVGHVGQSRDESGTLHLERLFVSPGASSRGIGERLVRQVTNGAHRGGDRLVLDVADNAATALRLYERLGWQRTGRSPVDWGGDLVRSLIHLEAPAAT